MLAHPHTHAYGSATRADERVADRRNGLRTEVLPPFYPGAAPAITPVPALHPPSCCVLDTCTSGISPTSRPCRRREAARRARHRCAAVDHVERDAVPARASRTRTPSNHRRVPPAQARAHNVVGRSGINDVAESCCYFGNLLQLLSRARCSGSSYWSLLTSRAYSPSMQPS